MKIVLKAIAVWLGCIVLSGIIGAILGLCNSMGYIGDQVTLNLCVIAGWSCKVLGIVLGLATLVKGIKDKVTGEA